MKKFFICILTLAVSLSFAGTSYGQMPRYQDEYISCVQPYDHGDPQKVPRIVYHNFNNQYAAMTTYNDQNRLLFHALDINFDIVTTKLISLYQDSSNLSKQVGVIFDDVKPVTVGKTTAYYIVLATVVEYHPVHEGSYSINPGYSSCYAIVKLSLTGDFMEVHYVDIPASLYCGTYELVSYKYNDTTFYAVNHENIVDIINTNLPVWTVKRATFDNTYRITSMQFYNNTLICVGNYSYWDKNNLDYRIIACKYNVTTSLWDDIYRYSGYTCNNSRRGVVSGIINGSLLIGSGNAIIKFNGLNLPLYTTKLVGTASISGITAFNNRIYLSTEYLPGGITELTYDLSAIVDSRDDSRNSNLSTTFIPVQIFKNQLTGYPALFGFGLANNNSNDGLIIAEALPSYECVKDSISDTLNAITLGYSTQIPPSVMPCNAYTGSGSNIPFPATASAACADSTSGSTGSVGKKEISSQSDNIYSPNHH